MKIRTHLLVWPICILLGIVVSGRAEKESKGKRPDTVSLKDREAWDSLSEEDRGKLKEALRTVWSDPAVISARADIQRAAEDYRAAVKNAVSKSDPKIAALLEQVQSANEGHFKERLGGRGPGHGGPGIPGVRPEWQGLLHPPGFMDSLDEAEKAQFRKAEAAAKETEAVKAAFAEVRKMREKDEAFQKNRIETLRQVRRAVQQEMIKIDPEVEKIIARGKPLAPKGRKRKNSGEKPGKKRPEADDKSAGEESVPAEEGVENR